MILYFTGTGNSRHLAFKLKAQLGHADIVDIGALIKEDKKGVFDSAEPYVFVLPTYGWRMPRIVLDFIKKADVRGDKRAYFLLTCGSSCGNAGKYAEKLCEEKGLTFMGCSGIKMPENYLAMFSVPDSEASEILVKQGENETDRLGNLIKDGKNIPAEKSFVGALESSIVNEVFYRTIVKAKGFRSTEQCTGCGLCSEVCVLNNIKISQGRPSWGDNCTHCMACICRCPEEAIEYKNKSEGKRRHYLAY